MNEINIFYADDDDDDLMFFEEAVIDVSTSNEKTIKLYAHKNGENLLDAIKQCSVSNSVIFLDLNMPIKNGFQFLKEIRNEPEINKIPIVIYSTSSEDVNIKLSQNLGANYYAVKPFNFNDLKAMVSLTIDMDWTSQEPDYNNFLFNKLVS